MTITLAQYFIGRAHTLKQEAAACDLLCRVNLLVYHFQEETGYELRVNRHTGSLISGLTEGGFRLPACAQGGKKSSHKILFGDGAGVDVYDPDNKFDAWLTDDILEKHGLYREHPDFTEHWCHLTTRAPDSGTRSFKPY